MEKGRLITVIACILVFAGMATAQITPWLYWTLLPKEQMDEIVGEASGETAWNTIMETGGYNKNLSSRHTAHEELRRLSGRQQIRDG